MLKAKSLSLQIFMRFLATSSTVAAWQSVRRTARRSTRVFVIVSLVQFTRLSPPAPFIDDRSATSLMKTANHSKKPQKKNNNKSNNQLLLGKKRSGNNRKLRAALGRLATQDGCAHIHLCCTFLHFTTLQSPSLPWPPYFVAFLLFLRPLLQFA
uniref:Secreted protein n=1 Tax=Bactrocera dorsalis TaxID=27457 RepID=A0A034WD73_BACDO